MTSTLIANTLSLVVLSIFIAHRWRLTHSWLEPGMLFAANLVILYPVRAIALISSEEFQPTYSELAETTNLEVISWMATVGCVSLVSGYLLFIPRRSITVLSGADWRLRGDDVAVCALFFVASLIGITYKLWTDDYVSFLISESRLEAFTQLGNLFAALQWPAFIAAWALWFRGLRSPGFVVLFCLIQIVIIPYQFVQGSKTYLSLLAVSIVIAHCWTKGRLPTLIATATVAFVALFVFPFVRDFRNSVIVENQTLDLRSVQQTIQNIDVYSPTFLSDQAVAISSRYAGIDELFGVTQVVPSILPYRYGLPYVGTLLNVIPRAVWPTKPIFSAGREYGAALGTITSVTPFPVGEAYWDAGLVGLFVSMFVWGALLAVMIRGYLRLYELPRLQFFAGTYFLSQIYWIAGGETSMPAILSSIPQQIVILLTLYHTLRAFGYLRRESEARLRRHVHRQRVALEHHTP
jgi:hypothetical protein